MRNIVKNVAAGTAIGGSLLFTAGLGISSAQPLNLQDGLVNLAVGDVTILENVNAAVAANVAAAICGLEVVDNVPIAVLAEDVDAGDEGETRTICNVNGGPITIDQNAGTPGQSGQAPGGGPATAPGNPTPGGGNR
jgi:hypothetical protein